MANRHFPHLERPFWGPLPHLQTERAQIRASGSVDPEDLDHAAAVDLHPELFCLDSWDKKWGSKRDLPKAAKKNPDGPWHLSSEGYFL